MGTKIKNGSLVPDYDKTNSWERIEDVRRCGWASKRQQHVSENPERLSGAIDGPQKQLLCGPDVSVQDFHWARILSTARLVELYYQHFEFARYFTYRWRIKVRPSSVLGATQKSGQVVVC